MSNQAAALRYAVRLPMLLKYFGQLCLVLAALSLPPLAISLAFGEFGLALRHGIVVIGLAAMGAGFSRMRAPGRMQPNEAIVLVASIFLLASLAGSYPLMGSGLDFSDALFEAISGVTTTGLTTIASIQDYSPAFMFTRSWMQWYGGLGIVVLSLALIVPPGVAAMGLAANENRESDLVGGAKAYARGALVVYGGISCAGVIAVWLAGATPLHAVLYTLSAVSTGGFGVRNASLAGLGWTLPTVILLLCVLGALPLSLYHQLLRRQSPNREDVLQAVTLAACLAVTTLLLAFSMQEAHQLDWQGAWRQAPLLAMTSQTTAGFSTMNVTGLDSGSKLVLILSMLIGGAVGSTAGGFKLLRLLLLLSLLRVVILRSCLAPDAEIAPRLHGRRLDPEEIHRALLVILLFLGVVACSWLAFVMAGYPSLDALFEVVSATGTVGLSAGVTRHELPGALKGILCGDMLLGRLEIVAWLVMFYPGTWIGRRLRSA